jgi:hypothetical protein
VLVSAFDMLRHALGLSAWKRLGSSRWSLRVNPVQRKPPSNRGVCDLRSAAGPRRSAGGVPLRGGSSCDRIALRIRRGRVARGVRRTTGQTVGRANIHSLARGVEIRRAGVPLLPARPRSRDSGRVGRRRPHRVACSPAAGVVTPRDRGRDRHRSRGGFQPKPNARSPAASWR